MIPKVRTEVLLLLYGTDDFATTFFHHYTAKLAEMSETEKENFNGTINPVSAMA